MTCCLKSMAGYFASTCCIPSCAPKVPPVPNEPWFEGDLNPYKVTNVKLSKEDNLEIYNNTQILKLLKQLIVRPMIDSNFDTG